MTTISADAGVDIYTVAREVDNADAEGRQPRLHQNGFIQLDLQPAGDPTRGHSGAFRRLHVFPWPKLQAQVSPSPIHDHVFDMRSDVLLGEIVQTMIQSDLQHNSHPTHEVWIPHYEAASESTLVRTGVFVRHRYNTHIRVGAGSSYTQGAHTFHETQWEGPAMTVMTKTHVNDGFDCRVLVPIGQEPDNEFRRDSISPTVLWTAIENALYLAKECAA